MSGNGIRCFAQALVERRGDLSDQLILTDAGDRLVVLDSTDDPATIVASVDMGDVSNLDRADRVGGARLPPRSPGGSPQPRQSAQRRRRRRRDRGRPRWPRRPGAARQPRDRRARSRTERHHDARARTWRRHHRSVRHRCVCSCLRSPIVGPGRPWRRRCRRAHGRRNGHRAASATMSPRRAILTGPATFIATIEVEVPREQHSVQRSARRHPHRPYDPGEDRARRGCRPPRSRRSGRRKPRRVGAAGRHRRRRRGGSHGAAS